MEGTIADRVSPGRSAGEPPGPAGRRLPGVDVARALALIGMFMVHLGSVGPADAAGLLYALPHGRASVLFVLVAGVGVSLLAGSGRSRAEVGHILLWRAAVLVPLGFWLQSLDHRVLVILPVYAALFVLGFVVMDWEEERLIRLAAACAALGPAVFLLGRLTAPHIFDRGPLRWTDPPLLLLHDVLFSGPYPLVVWAVPFLAGMIIGRRDLQSVRLRRRLVAGGFGLAAGSMVLSAALQVWLRPQAAPMTWTWVVVDLPHSQMPLWLVGATGAAACGLGLALEAAARLRGIVWPLAATGQLALTLYAGHLLLLHALPGRLTAATAADAVVLVALVTAGAVVFATVWRAFFSRGPLEALLRLPVGSRRRGDGPAGKPGESTKGRDGGGDDGG